MRRRRWAIAILVLLALALFAARVLRAQVNANTPVVVASKPFGESFLLAEMFAQVLERYGFRVERKPGLGATEVAFAALRSGSIDVYPEYTGTGLIAILHDSSAGDARTAFNKVSGEFADQFGLRWLAPLGFENTYAIAVTKATAAKFNLHTLTDLSRAAPSLVAGLTPDFIGRSDGLPALQRKYGMKFAAVKP